MKKLHTQESGKSMVEMLGVLAIVGVLSVGGIAGYSQAMAKFKITKALDQIQTITTNIRSLFASQRTFEGLDTESAYNMGILTDETYDDGTKNGINPFGGEIIIETNAGASSVNDSTFVITYTQLDKETCIKIATSSWGTDASSGLYTMNIDSNQYSWTANGTRLLPISLINASADCQAGDGGSDLSWEYR